jgi:hypothetical protein
LKFGSWLNENDCGFEIADCGLNASAEFYVGLPFSLVAALNPQSEIRNPKLLWLVLN